MKYRWTVLFMRRTPMVECLASARSIWLISLIAFGLVMAGVIFR